jgi:hypothetical protein
MCVCVCVCVCLCEFVCVCVCVGGGEPRSGNVIHANETQNISLHLFAGSNCMCDTSVAVIELILQDPQRIPHTVLDPECLRQKVRNRC